MVRILLTYVLFFALFTLYPIKVQATFMAVPNIRNHLKEEYKAGNQNWAIEQDDFGVMYFGNNNGVLVYDGANWLNVPMPNNSVVRSLKFNGINKIFIGAFNEFGTIDRDSIGNYQYNSWITKIPVRERQFADIWKIHILDQYIYFQSYSFVFVFNIEGTFIKRIKFDHELTFSFLVDNSILVQDKSEGLKRISDSEPILIKHLEIPQNLEIWDIISLKNKGRLLFTQQEGIFKWDGEDLKPWHTELSEYLKKNNFYCLTQDENYLYIGTIQKGLIVADKNGNILTVFDRISGLQNNTILSVKLDKEKNIWLGLDNGIDYIEWNSNIHYIGRNGNYGTGYSSAKWHNNIYLGTNQGVFKVSANNRDKVFLLDDLKGQVWDLWINDGQLLCAHHKGIYSIKDKGIEEIKLLPGCWMFLPLPWDSDRILIGTYNGIGLMEKTNTSYRYIKMIEGFHESSRVMLFDDKDNLWISHGYKGLFKIKLNKEDISIDSLSFYGPDKGLPSTSNNEIYFARNEVIITTVEGIYFYDEEKDTIVPYDKWNRFFGNTKRVSKIFEFDENTIYVFQDAMLGRLDILDDSLFMYNRQIAPAINNHFIEAFEDILFLDENTLLVGIDDGFAMIDSRKDQNTDDEIPLLFNSIECYATEKFQDIVQPLAFNTYSEPIIIENRIPFKFNNIRIGFSVPLYNTAKNIRFHFTLNDTYWEGRPNQSELFLTNLHEGKYLLKIHVFDTKSGQKITRIIQFTIEAPWFRQWYFYALLGVLILTIALTSYLLIKRRIDYERRKELIAQKRKMIQREIRLKQKSELAEKELIKIRNEKLQSEVIHKSKELANSTMNIIHKNQILTDLKNKMMVLSDDQSGGSTKEIKSLIRKIDTELEDQKSWNVFETHFDRVHENFFQRLRDQHPELSPKDLRMCAFLRMNLSSKEIAPLQNISIRSVEISRYRLRKKLNIPHAQNLTDYIMSV